MHRSRASATRFPVSRRPRVVRASVGAALVDLTLLLVLGPVLGLVGTAAAVGPVLQVPYAGITVVVGLALLLSVACVVGAYRTRVGWLGWTLVAVGVLLALLASLWPLLATADAAVDSARDVWPWISRLLRDVT
ncbi:hypothetical protein [Kineococcus rhizosphaerae]|uniref:Uncharacterized protein n=1 Tax=Kineococcus rhizosphaerae TaxID=559628 RepID=A0A2T0R3E6_9ACTN|nr:hypothetical protein [Kineococcus rhizosphaerae]PRY14572.1 hypothetical protein CLV37_106130 [Kineococcus rhizosphaerae]